MLRLLCDDEEQNCRERVNDDLQFFLVISGARQIEDDATNVRQILRSCDRGCDRY